MSLPIESPRSKSDSLPKHVEPITQSVKEMLQDDSPSKDESSLDIPQLDIQPSPRKEDVKQDPIQVFEKPVSIDLLQPLIDTQNLPETIPDNLEDIKVNGNRLDCMF